MSNREYKLSAAIVALLLFTVTGVQAHHCSKPSSKDVNAQQDVYEGEVYRVGNDPVSVLIITLDSGKAYEIEAKNKETQRFIENSQWKRVRVHGTIRNEPAVHGDGFISVDRVESVE